MWLVFAVVLIGASTAILDVAVVNVAIPSIRSYLHARSGVVELVTFAYAVVYARLLVTGGLCSQETPDVAPAGPSPGRGSTCQDGRSCFSLSSTVGCSLLPTGIQPGPGTLEGPWPPPPRA